MKQERNIIWLHFHQPTHGKQDWFFTSLRAMFNRFSRADIGATIEYLWTCHISDTNPYSNNLCQISRHKVNSTEQ